MYVLVCVYVYMVYIFPTILNNRKKTSINLCAYTIRQQNSFWTIHSVQNIVDKGKNRKFKLNLCNQIPELRI